MNGIAAGLYVATRSSGDAGQINIGKFEGKCTIEHLAAETVRGLVNVYSTGAIPNCVYKNRELCWGIRGLVSAFSFAGHLLGVPVPCAELMTAFV